MHVELSYTLGTYYLVITMNQKPTAEQSQLNSDPDP